MRSIEAQAGVIEYDEVGAGPPVVLLRDRDAHPERGSLTGRADLDRGAGLGVV